MHTCVLFNRYFVFADPEGPKIGNGGATLHVLEQLEQKLSEDELNQGMFFSISWLGFI